MVNVDWNHRCWVCGSKKNVTGHHVLPKGMKPKKNRKIPLCDKCHKEYNYFYASHCHITGTHRLSKYNELNSTVQEVLDENVVLSKRVTDMRIRFDESEKIRQDLVEYIEKIEYVYIPNISRIVASFIVGILLLVVIVL